MAFLQSDTPFQNQLTNIAGAVQGPGVTGLQGGQGGQLNLANVLQALSTPNLAGGTGQAFNISNILQELGQTYAGTGGAGASTIQSLLQALGLGEYATGGQALGEAIQTETTGKLPQGAQDIVAQNLSDRQNAIRGKYAQLGMTGSSDEANELDQAQRQSLQDQFTISQSLGNLLGQQGLTALAGGGGLVGGAGNLNAVLAQLGLGALTTSGNLGTTLGSLGLTGLNLSQQDYANLASEGLQALNIEQGVYTNVANQNIAQDKQTTDLLGGFFKALAGAGAGFAVGGPAGALVGGALAAGGGGFNLNLGGGGGGSVLNPTTG